MIKAWLYPLFLSSTLLVSPVLANSVSTEESDKKNLSSQKLTAAYVYNFLSYANWPEFKHSTQMRLCVAGQNRDTLLFTQLAGRKIQNLPLEITLVNSGSDLSSCWGLFIASAEHLDLLDLATQYPLLVMTNLLPDHNRKAAIRIFPEQGRLKFEVNISLLNDSQVKLSASVLNLASRVLR